MEYCEKCGFTQCECEEESDNDSTITLSKEELIAMNLTRVYVGQVKYLTCTKEEIMEVCNFFCKELKNYE